MKVCCYVHFPRFECCQKCLKYMTFAGKLVHKNSEFSHCREHVTQVIKAFPKILSLLISAFGVKWNFILLALFVPKSSSWGTFSYYVITNYQIFLPLEASFFLKGIQSSGLLINKRKKQDSFLKHILSKTFWRN